MKMRMSGLIVIAVSILLVHLSGTAMAASPVSPLISTREYISPDQLRPGMTGYGKTVFSGNKLETFKVTVLGVMHHESFDSDMILIRITSGPVVTRHWGIIAGMSGSPIYINGKLAGALAYAWSFSKEPIAGVTPIRQMAENYLPGSIKGLPTPLAKADFAAGATFHAKGAPLRIGNRRINLAQISLGNAGARSADPHTMLLTPVATPVMVSGLGSRAMKELAKLLEPHGLVPMATAGSAPKNLPAKIAPGSAIGVQLVGGDINMTAIGTATYVRNGRVLAMGHPFLGSGPVDLPMTNAYVHGILSSQEVSFKLASGGNIIGRWTEDRPNCVGGMQGEKATVFPGNYTIIDKARGLQKNYAVVFSRLRRLMPMLSAITTNEAVASIIPEDEGTLQADFEVTSEGLPAVHRKNIYSQPLAVGGGIFSLLFGSGGGASSPASEIAAILHTLENNPYKMAFPKQVTLRAEWTKERRVATIEDLRARARRVKPGDKIEVEVFIQPYGKPREMRLVEVEVPRNAPPGRLQVGIAGGMSAQMIKSRLQAVDPQPTNLAQQLELLAKEEKNDDLLVEVSVETSGMEFRGKQLYNLPEVVMETLASSNSSEQRVIRDHFRKLSDVPYVLSGGDVLNFTVETDEKDKAGRGPSVSMGAFGMGLSGGLLRSLLEGGGEGDGGEGDMLHKMQADAPEEKPDKSDESAAEDMPPDMPSFDELQDLESQEPETVTAEGAAEKPKGKSLLRPAGIWEDVTDKDFAKGKTFGTAVNSAGQIDLAPTAKTIYNAPEGMLWAQAADSKGNLYVSSWLDGTVKKINDNGSAKLLLNLKNTEAKDVTVLSLICDAADNVYAAAAPSGTIYRIAPDGKIAKFSSVTAPYVWAMAFDGEKNLLAATGPEGKLFQISPEGTAQVVFTAPDRHVIAMTASSGGAYFATYPRGKVYRLSGGKVSPVYETIPTVTALSLCTDTAGNLFIGTSPSGQIIRINPQGKAKLLYKSQERHIFSMWPAPDGSIYAATGPRGRIYRVFPTGEAEMVWDGKMGNLVALTASSDRLFSSLSITRQLIRLDLKGDTEGTFESSVFDASGPSNWGQIRWQSSLPQSSSVTLQTRAGNTAFPDSTWSDWSAPYSNATGENITATASRYLQYRATLKSASAGWPSLRRVQVFYFNLNRPPELKLLEPAHGPVWSGKKSVKWTATDPDKGDTLTYQVFYSGDQGKTWTEIKEPEKKKEEAKKPEAKKPEEKSKPAEKGKGKEKPKDNAKPAEKAPAAPAPAAGVKAEENDTRDTGDNDAAASTDKPDQEEPDAAAAETKPTEKKAGEEATKEAAEEKPKEEAKPAGPTKATSMNWDTTKATDGLYLIKVIASDKQSNPKDPMSDERISDPVRVDNTAPTIGLDKTPTPAAPPAKVKVTDAGTYVASAEYRVDKGDWKGALSEDGIYDGQTEMVVIDPADLTSGEHTLELRARDGVGNEATGEVKYKK